MFDRPPDIDQHKITIVSMEEIPETPVRYSLFLSRVRYSFHIIRYNPFRKVMRLEIEFREDSSRTPNHAHTQKLLFIRTLVFVILVMPNARGMQGIVSCQWVLARCMPASLAILDFSDQGEKIALPRTTGTSL
jgi:hypothetical protein